MDVFELDYPLPEGAIAQEPAECREDARLLVDRGAGRPPDHLRVADLPDVLRRGDLLVVNDSRVLPARLHVHKASGGAVEVLLLEQQDDGSWEALVRPSRRVVPGLQLTGRGDVVVDVVAELGEGRWRVVVTGDIDSGGEMPLPPYIHPPLREAERYQTVYSRRPVSAAAPTAGLHLTHDVLDRCRERHRRRDDRARHRTRHVSARDDGQARGPRDALGGLRRAGVDVRSLRAAAERVVAVGTTVVRALESAAATGARAGARHCSFGRGSSFKWSTCC